MIPEPKHYHSNGVFTSELNQVNTGADLLDAIAKRAYFLYLNSAAVHGHDLDHWLSAEKQALVEGKRRFRL